MKKIIFIFVALFSYQTNAGIPTFDAANIVQSTISAIQNVKQATDLATQLQEAKDQYDEVNAQFDETKDLISGATNFSFDKLLNSSVDDARGVVPDTFDGVLALFVSNSGAQGFGEVFDYADKASQDLRIADDAEIYDDLTSDDAHRAQMHVANTKVAVGTSEASFNRVAKLLDDSETLMEQIANTTSPKEAQDLSNRLNGQTHLLLAELIRIQSSQAATQAKNQLYEEAIRKEERKRGVVRSFQDFFSEATATP